MHGGTRKCLIFLVLSVVAIAKDQPSVLPPPDESNVFRVPAAAEPDGQFRNGRPQLTIEYPETTFEEIPVPDIYNARDIDLPLGRLFHGNMTMFPTGELNDPSLDTDNYQTGIDSETQSASLNTLPQPAYFDNWFAQPVLPNVKPNPKRWDMNQKVQQFKSNQISYPKRGWPTHPHGWEIPTPEMKASSVVPFDDWIPGQEPSWQPIDGGKGFGTPELSRGLPLPRFSLDDGIVSEVNASATTVGAPRGQSSVASSP
ncbi:MAG: hypothetical protein Q9214_000554, partial [Letrouitia sp. 1 TL-2023]